MALWLEGTPWSSAGVAQGSAARSHEGWPRQVPPLPLPKDSYLVLVLAAVLLLCAVALLVYFLSVP